MKLAFLLFVFVLIGSINVSIQGGKKYYPPKPNKATGCWEGYVGIIELCDRDIPDGMGRRGFGLASGSECNRICVYDHFHSSGICGPLNHCCCRP